MPDGGALVHHGSHRDLLWPPGHLAVTERPIDAIIVPTARPSAYLDQAARLAHELSCTLVTLHSKKWTMASSAEQRIPPDIDLIAIDVPQDPAQLNLPYFKSTHLLAGTIFARKSDLSIKRNLAVMLCRMLGWSRVLFLDDDINGLNPEDMRQAIGLLDMYNAVGLRIGGFPDHSVVCHAYRQAGGPQEAFIGGGAMAVEMDRSKPFYPDIYNDDWFFMLDEKGGLQPVTSTGTVIQSPYDPFRNISRARAEELGDVLAEGIYWLLDQGQSIFEANEEHWASFLANRRQFIERVLGMVRARPFDARFDAAEKRRQIAALKVGSLGRLDLITPGLCVAYLRAWAADRERWHCHLDQIPTGLTRQQALAALPAAGMPPLMAYVREEKAPAKPAVGLDSPLQGVHAGPGERHDQLTGDRRSG
jgi:hypothetical protein